MSAFPYSDSHFMKMALREAHKGEGRTAPNPCVGAVVVKNGRLIAKGYHHQAGTPHAEVHALNAAGTEARGATLYVTLEPCHHQGRTGPCTERIVAAGISRVVVGMNDPNPLVAGGGNDYLASNGIKVTAGILAESCLELNRPFVKHIVTGLPWMVMKAGLSLDGRIGVGSPGGRVTGDESRREVHRLRNRFDAILVGIETVLADDPALTTRLPWGKGRDPLRVVLDRSLRCPVDSRLLTQQSTAATLIFCGPDVDQPRRQKLSRAGAEIMEVPLDPAGGLSLPAVLATLGRIGIMGVLVEGGGRVHASFLRDELYDQACLFLAPVLFGARGVPLVGDLACGSVADGKRLEIRTTRRLGSDIMIEGLFR
ncbi:MAG: bifunctional diaminohydroxyphosphoribosylaminopyrimidine deaminase/5-amino-6-(5-phosphoribosylamino)uracil reductase RibD [Proteobacteria bacterium]|nr:bifunctional diaminohydroxyphosphoribosylaminopyrimidine deaminase/5-amino-6-(5-phosphoribosylamino)uracil reductase RibD [Pseudomonadota bacterium]MBU1688909.1 bifunctional diaminohydroxyphosphoribosylaminopyrimidine deaminase/5-amino-6-(5-phosphoribosylamino)uracil reductase RibD [Pseudomonadota bacterium]